MGIINIIGLSKYIGEKKILQNINIEIVECSTTAIIGENGSGKTSIIKILANQDSDYKGEVLIFNKRVEKLFNEIKKSTGFMFQNVKYNQFIKMKDLIKLYSKIYNINSLDLFNSYLSNLNILTCKEEYIENLSSGQIQKFNLALSILHRPKLLILDEPTSAIDPNSRKEIWKLLLNLKKEGMSIFLSSHNLEEVSILSDKVILLSNGSIKEVIDNHPIRELENYIFELDMEVNVDLFNDLSIFSFFRINNINYLFFPKTISNLFEFQKIIQSNHINEKMVKPVEKFIFESLFDQK